MLTLTQIADRFDVSRTCVDHALRRDGLKHAERIGNARVWVSGDLPAIQEALSKSVRNRRIPIEPTGGGEKLT